MTTVRKVNLIEFWRVGELESWYHDMHRKGLMLVSASSSFSKFKKVEPEEVLYRIEITVKEQIDDEQLHLIEDSGWDYVTSVKQFHVFRAPASRQAPEIHSDPTVQAEAFEKLAAKTKFAAIVSSVIGVALIAIFIAYCLSIDGFLYHMIVDNNYFMLFQYGFFIMTLLFIWKQFISLKKVTKQLQEGKQFQHDVPYKRYSWVLTASIILLLVAFSSFYYVSPLATKMLTDVETLPIVSLSMVEQDSSLYEAEDLVNRYEQRNGLFINPYYETAQSLRSKDQQNTDNSGAYEPTIWNTYYYVKLPFLRHALYESTSEQHKFYGAFELVANTYFDRLEAYQEDGYYQILALKDGHILYVHYFGMEPFDSVVAAMEKTIQKVD